MADFRRFATIVCASTALLAMGWTGEAWSQAVQRPVTLRVPSNVVSGAPSLESIGAEPVQVLEYGAFRWVELTPEDAARVHAAGVAAQVVPGAGEVRVQAYRFDPLYDGEPDLASAQRATPAGSQLRLVQFHGPTAFDWLERLAAAGSRVLQYYPHNTYLVWSGPEAAEGVALMPFVRWQGLFHPGYKISDELNARAAVTEQGRTIDNVDLTFYNDGDVQAVLDAVRHFGGEILNHQPAQPDQAFFNAIVRMRPEAMEAVARLPQVLALGYQSPRPILDDEASDQIIAGNYTGSPSLPVTGYGSFLAGLGYDGTGVIWSVTDTGVDYDHADLNSRIVGGQNYPGCTPANPGDATSDGHGTHVAGIVGGDATAGFTDGDGFFYGLGVAPNYSIFAQNPICPSLASWPPAGGWQVLSRNGVLGGAVGANNSWTSGEGTQHGYQATERTHDLMVRDGNFDTAAVAEPYTLVFSAGNSGFSGLTSPKEAKNLIVTANSLNSRAGSIDAISSSSSRGPAVDGRTVPTVAAPGTTIASTRADGGGSCTSPIAGTSNQYAFCSGTSMASPHVAGAVVLITEWWRDTQGSDPSAALAKALLVNGAVDMGTADVPNTFEGWGRVHLANTLQPSVERFYVDQSTILSGTGQTVQYNLAVDDPGQPVKVTLAWSDAPGAIGANPALVNNLDLTVDLNGTVYLGNDFASGVSTTGGSADSINNLENVFAATGGATSMIVTITAAAIVGDGVPYNADGTDQDFALVCHNCSTAQEIFSDGFESGTTGAWSLVVE